MSPATDLASPAPSAEFNPATVAVKIVGGGIAGMYAAYRLGRIGFNVELFEASPGPREDANAPADRSRAYGGRIESQNIGGFYAEFGPMRFEPNLQTSLRRLAFHLGIGFTSFPPTGAPRFRNEYAGMTRREEQAEGPLTLLTYGVLSMFFAGEVPDDSGDDIDKRIEALTQRMDESLFLRRVGDNEWAARSDDDIDDQLHELRCKQVNVDPKLQTRVGQAPLLKDLGIWNALSYVLRPAAIVAIRDAGTFYHFIQLNVSALEWGIFWLRQISKLGDLYNFKPETAAKGTHTLISELFQRLDLKNNVTLSEGYRVVDLRPAKLTHEVTLNIEEVPTGPAGFGEPWAPGNQAIRRAEITADHVILALPQLPLRDLSAHFPKSVKDRIEMVVPLAMMKAFLVTNRPWWSAGIRAQTQTSSVPTRELHYYSEGPMESEDRASHGMVMLYTDTPALSFWQAFILPPFQHGQVEFPSGREADDERMDPEERLKKALVKCLLVDANLGMQRDLDARAREIWQAGERVWQPSWGRCPVPTSDEDIVATLLDIEKRTRSIAQSGPNAKSNTANQALRDAINAVLKEQLDMSEQDPLAAVAKMSQGPADFTTLVKSVEWYAVHDWSRLPFGGAAHVWKAGACWERGALSKFALAGRDKPGHLKNVHICGEAHSGFQGFIEGALRTADEVVTAICETYKLEPPPPLLTDAEAEWLEARDRKLEHAYSGNCAG